jgi:hypothetical protein
MQLIHKGKSFFCAILIFALAAGATISVYGTGIVRQRPKDQVVVELAFDNAQDAELFKIALLDSRQELATYYKSLIKETQDKDKVAFLLEKVAETYSIDVDAMFSVKEDSTSVLFAPEPNVEITRGSQAFFADKKGELVIDHSILNETVTISLDGIPIETDKLATDGAGKLEAEQQLDGSYKIKIKRTLDDLAVGMSRMGEAMAVEGQGYGYKPQMPVSTNDPTTKWSPNSNQGASPIVLSTAARKNIVACNKIHGAYNESVNAVQLFLGQSDCGKAIRKGMLSSTIMSRYCWQESLASSKETNSETNGTRFCNGIATHTSGDNKPKNGKINCSSFAEINHPEEGHWHT